MALLDDSLSTDILLNESISEASDTAIATTATNGHPHTMTGWQLINMNMGFLGIQFAWGLQMANMSAIFERLGATAHQLPILWLAAPMTGLVVQPIIGNLSDYTWTPLGRRRPYFLTGAVIASSALLLIPHCFHLWEVVLLLWLLDTSANVSGVPFRAFVGDLLSEQQQTAGFAVQSVMVGLGAVSASAFPWVLSHWFHIGQHGPDQLLQMLPTTVEFSFYGGAIAFLLTIVWTIVTTPEHPPQNATAFTQLQAERGGVIQSIQEVWTVSLTMPPVMKQLAWVQFFSWLGAFCFFLYFPPAVAHNIFGAVEQQSALYDRGIEWAGICFALFNAVCILFSLALPTLVQWSDRRTVHCLSLLCGGVSLVAIAGITNPYLLLIAMVGFGITWASMLSLPFAMLSGVIPPKRQGIYQGIFNFFIVIPEIVVSLGFGWVMEHWLHDNRLIAVILGGCFILVAALLTQWVTPPVVVDPGPRSSD